METPAELTPRQRDLLKMLPLNEDVSVTTLYESFIGHADGRDRRQAQQYLGSWITRLNRRLKKHRLRVQPGRLKHTYRLVSTR